jgi:hypothetical protein
MKAALRRKDESGFERMGPKRRIGNHRGPEPFGRHVDSFADPCLFES